MRFLLDTNVVSVLARAAREALVYGRIRSVRADHLFISALTMGELRYGIRRLPEGPNRESLRHWVDVDLADTFAGQVLPVDEAVCDAWADLRVAAGRTLPVTDSLIAATAIAHDMVLVTRNVRDFQGVPIRPRNPWDTPTPPS